jgi:hypothetical protein
MSATAKAAMTTRVIIVESWALVEAKITRKTNGNTINPPNCCAARMSFTLEETIMFASTLMMHARGAITPITINQYGFGIKIVPI